MRRWNGWGDEAVRYPLPRAAKRLLAANAGPGEAPLDAALDDVAARVPASKLPPHPLVHTDPEQRVRHAVGQSLPDWVAARGGTIAAFPDGVAFPQTNDDVREILRHAAEAGARVIPYGGGTSVVGHVTVRPGRPALSVDLGRMNRLLDVDEASLLATFQAGVRGPDLEAALRARGLTLGHFPQSFEYSTLGGWVATRSAGQFSLGYGRIEDLFAGGRLETPAGMLEMPPFPASAAGPDLKQIVLGSEGRLGVLVEAIVRVRAVPEAEAYATAFVPDFARGLEAVRDLSRSGLPLVMLRLSTAEETTATLALAGRERLAALLERWLRLRGLGPERCMLLAGAAGKKAHVRAAMREAMAAARARGGVGMGRRIAGEWVRHRFRSPYLRNAAWEAGYALDTVETAAPWSRVPALVEAIERELRGAGERVYAFTHLSHAYPDGANVYTTYVFRAAPDPEETLARWRALKGAATRAITAGGGTISHQHGVGSDHRRYLEGEKGRLGVEMLWALCRALDPKGIMNPGALV